MSFFWRFLLAHFITDFPLQTRWFIKNKGRVLPTLLHSFVFFLVSIAAFYDVIFDEPVLFISFFVIFIFHFLIDLGKSKAVSFFGNNIIIFSIDQLLHIASIYFTWSYFFPDDSLLGKIRYFMLAFAVFVIWGIPVVCILISNIKNKKSSNHTYIVESDQILMPLERMCLYIGLLPVIIIFFAFFCYRTKNIFNFL
jgi:hypothetical protein